MATPRLASGALALAVLLMAALPVAAAASGHFQAEAATLAGPTALTAGGAHLRWTGTEAPVLEVAASAVHIDVIGVRTQDTPYAQVNHWPYTESADHRDATLVLAAGAAEAILALQSDAALAADLSASEVRPVQHATVAREVPGRVCYDGEPACWEVAGVTEARTDRARVQLPGEVRLLLHGPTLVVRDASGETRYASGATQTREGVLTTTEDAWVLVTLQGAVGTLLAEGDVAVYAPAPVLRTTHAILDGATGRLDAGLRAFVARGERMTVEGDLEVAPGSVEGARNANDGRAATYAGAFPVLVRGDVERVSLAAVPIYASSPAAAAGLVAIVLALLSGLAYAWPLVQFHATSALVPFYTRLKSPQLLDNRVRSAIYDIIRSNPGISARNVHRLSDQSWGTVVYHLRQLEKHDLVVSRTVGRTRNYYENHGKYRGMEVQLACLRSERARVLARLVLTTPGIAQEELVVRSTYPQPTTSYYVRKLKSAGLVEERRDGRYARYHPIGDIARFLDIAESDAAPA